MTAMLPHIKVWLDHFEYHALHPRKIPEGVTNLLTEDEKHLIGRSTATFQLGEQSEGGSLMKAAQRFAALHNEPRLVRITELFIKEEQQHATLLREFMEDHGIALSKRDWTDQVFRGVRKLADYELYVSVLITAELIANVYYRALETVTGCQKLRVLCRMLVADELAHVAFESEMLLAIRSKRPMLARLVIDALHRSFFFGATCVVWVTHYGVLRRAGYRLDTFLRACHAQYEFYLKSPFVHAPTTSTP
jgi:hypothetical protein